MQGSGQGKAKQMFVLMRSRGAMRIVDVVVVVWYGLQAQEQASKPEQESWVREGRGPWPCEEKAQRGLVLSAGAGLKSGENPRWVQSAS